MRADAGSPENFEDFNEAEQEDNLDFCLSLAERAHLNFWEPDNLPWLDLIEREHDSLRAALAWALHRRQADALRLAGALAPFWCVKGYLSEGREWLERVLEISDEVQGRVPGTGSCPRTVWPWRLGAHAGGPRRRRHRL